MNCKDCQKDFYFDCNQEPCNKLIAWEQLKETDRQTDYKEKGAALDLASD